MPGGYNWREVDPKLEGKFTGRSRDGEVALSRKCYLGVSPRALEFLIQKLVL